MVRRAEPTPAIQRVVAEALGDEIVDWHPATGGYSSAGLWVVTTSRGLRGFVKAANTADTARFLRDEMCVYEQLSAPFMPEVKAWIEDETHPILILEDLSGFRWPPPWTRHEVDAVLDVCADIAATPPPVGLGNDVEVALAEVLWPAIVVDLASVVELNVASFSWFEKALPLLAEVETHAVVTGQSLVHGDLRSDNLCIGDQVKVIDWNWAFIGNPMIDIVAWLPSLYLEGGPAPWDLLHGEAALVSRLAGYFLSHATMAPRPDVRSDIRNSQRKQGAVSLQWVARELGLPPPDLLLDR